VNPKIPPPPVVLYFLSKDSFTHELTENHPARKKDGTMGPLKDMSVGEDIEVFIGSGWVPGYLRGKPSVYKFVVDCVTFDDERTVWRAIEEALRQDHGHQMDPIPWLKVIPPSKQVEP